MKRFLSALLAVFMIATLICVPAFAEGEGDAAPLDETVTPTYDWYTTEAGATMYIDSASDFLGLCYLASIPNSTSEVDLGNGNKITSAVNFANQTVVLTEDISMNPNWVKKHQAGEKGYCVTFEYVEDSDPADKVVMPTTLPDNKFTWGSPISSFQGVFDGQGHTISGLYVAKEGANGHLGGLIGTLGANGSTTATVKNVILTDSIVYGQINTKKPEPSKDHYTNRGISALVGGVAGGTIDNVYVDADVIHYGGTRDKPNVGGIVGMSWDMVFKNAVFAGAVYATNNVSNMKLDSIPNRNSQLVANNHGGYTATIKNCAAIGTLKSGDMDLAIKDGGTKLTIENYLTKAVDTLASDAIADSFKPMYNGNKDTWNTYNAETVDMVYSKVAGAIIPATVAAMLNHNTWAQTGTITVGEEQVKALRILTGLESLDWAEVSYTVKVGEKTESTGAITTVYESVTAAGEDVAASTLNANYEYLYGVVIKNIPDNCTLTVTPVVTTAKGTVVTLHSFTVVVENGQVK